MRAMGGAKREIANDGPGLIAIRIARNILLIVPLIIKAMGEQAAGVLATDLHVTITERIQGKVEARASNATTQHLIDILQVSVPEVISAALVRLLPAFLLRSITYVVTKTVTLGVTHALTATLSRSLSTSPMHENACYQCAYFARHCETCFANDPERTLDHVRAYYSRHYGAFYGDYYAEYYTNNPAWNREGSYTNDGSHAFKAFTADPAAMGAPGAAFDPATFPPDSAPPPIFPNADVAKGESGRQAGQLQKQLSAEQASAAGLG
jgi:hypothetical protein